MAYSSSVNGTRSQSIVIVEDDAFVAGWVEEMLTEAGFSVAGTAASAAEAMPLAAATRPALALMDIQLSGRTDGVKLACALRDKYSVPTIFFSGFIDAATMERAQAARPLGFIPKPFRPAQVFNAVERALSAADLSSTREEDQRCSEPAPAASPQTRASSPANVAAAVAAAAFAASAFGSALAMWRIRH